MLVMICAKVAHTVRSGDLIEHHTQSYQGCSLNCDASAGMVEDVFFLLFSFLLFFFLGGGGDKSNIIYGGVCW